MKQLITCFILLISAAAFGAEPYTAWWQQGNKLYEQKEYDSAAHYYERIAALKPADADVYYNLGNAYYKLNDIGNAVLNYEKALALAPANKQASDNLTLAQSRISNRINSPQDIFFVQWWKSITSPQKAGVWATISLLSFLLLIGIAIATLLGKLQLNIPMQATGIAWSLCIVFIVFAFASANRSYNHNKAVVMQNDCPFYVSPQQTKAQAYIPEGTTIKLENEQQGWAEVTLPDGRTGWVQLSILSKV